MEDCFIVWVQHLQSSIAEGISALQRMFGSLWNVVVAREHGDKTAVVGQVRWRHARQRPMNEHCDLEANALVHW